MGKFDYIPPGMEEHQGKLIKKREDPYVLIQQLKLKVVDLQRKIDQGENGALMEGNNDLRKINGELTKKLDNLGKEHEGLKLFLADVQKERDSLREEHAMIRKQAKELKDSLPPTTVDMGKMASLEKENANLRVQISLVPELQQANEAMSKEISKLKGEIMKNEGPRGRKG